LPYRILPALQIPVYAEMAERDADFCARLQQAGFLHDFGEDDGSDLIVYATSYGSMHGYVGQIVTQAAADKLGKC
jgi:putative flavoprotein involved in K+ transport